MINKQSFLTIHYKTKIFLLNKRENCLRSQGKNNFFYNTLFDFLRSIKISNKILIKFIILIFNDTNYIYVKLIDRWSVIKQKYSNIVIFKGKFVIYKIFSSNRLAGPCQLPQLWLVLSYVISNPFYHQFIDYAKFVHSLRERSVVWRDTGNHFLSKYICIA